jgi:lipid A ethanolaminephosphotransferase
MKQFKVFLQQLITPQIRYILLATLWITLTGNLAFYNHLIKIYPPTVHHLLLVGSICLFFTLVTAILLLLICQTKLTRWLLALFLILASQAAYYMDTYNVIIDDVMLDNMFHTNTREFLGLFSFNLMWRTALFGLLPAWLVIKYTPTTCDFKRELTTRAKLIGIMLITMLLLVLPLTGGYFNFAREHKTTRFYANPSYFTYSIIKYTLGLFAQKTNTVLQKTATDAVELDTEKHHELMIMVVGETARFDRFSLNGYHKETNPALKQENVLSFTNVSSCGTSTGISVPCMFSVLGRKDYDKEKSLNMENALDVLVDNGVAVMWRDNNSDSKGVATRVKYEDFSSPTLNPSCEGECRDIGMLSGLDTYIKSKKDQDILIVLHQMGNHGPEYYRRYTKEFERFTPTCKSGELDSCTQAEVDNAYDNAVVYTDYFLSQTIAFLKKYDNQYETAMFYVSDHGESLGEKGIYLHAAPYAIAPKEQTHVPAILWLGKHFDYNLDQVKPYKDEAFSHDDLFCMLMITYEIDTKTCFTKRGALMQNLDFAKIK